MLSNLYQAVFYDVLWVTRDVSWRGPRMCLKMRRAKRLKVPL